MKKSKLLVVVMITVLSTLAYAPAKAGTTQTSQQESSLLSGLSDWLNGLFGGSGSGSGSGTGSGSTGSSGTGTSTSLPINGNVWLLVVAGAVVGCKVIMDKNRKEMAAKA